MQFATTRERADLHRRRDIITDSIARIEQRRDKLARERAELRPESYRARAMAFLIEECDASLCILERQARRHDEQARRFGGPQIEYRHVPAV